MVVRLSTKIEGFCALCDKGVKFGIIVPIWRPTKNCYSRSVDIANTRYEKGYTNKLHWQTNGNPSSLAQIHFYNNLEWNPLHIRKTIGILLVVHSSSVEIL